MLQEVLVYIIVFLAVGGAICYMRKKLRAMKKNTEEHACTDCPLRSSCSKPLTGKLACDEGVANQ